MTLLGLASTPAVHAALHAALHPSASGSGSGGGAAGLLLPAVGVVFLVLFMRRSSRKRQAEAQSLRGALEVGAEVMTGGGLFGTVRGVEDDAVRLEIAPGVVVRFATPAITRVITPEDPAEPLPPASD